MATADESALGVYDRKVLRKIFGPLREYRSCWNDKLYEIYGDIDIVQRIKRERQRWLGLVVRMDKNTPALKVLDAVPAEAEKEEDLHSIGKTR